MQHGLPLLLLGALILASHGACAQAAAPQTFQHQLTTAAKPWTHERFDASQHKFTFAIFSDLNGSQRPGVFETAIAQLNLLRPELILSVGDLIDGGSEDRDKLHREWDEFDADTGQSIAPVYYAGGNHDLTNMTMRDVWEERYGARYYHFVYKNVLFVILDTEDNSATRMQQIFVARAVALDVLQGRSPGVWGRNRIF